MAPNPIMIPRNTMPRHFKIWTGASTAAAKPSVNDGIGLALAVAVFAILPIKLSWVRMWIYSGAAVESALVVYGARSGNRIFPDIPLWTLLATLNLVYAVCSTSWLLWGIFATACYISVLLTSIFQFHVAANLARKVLRRLLGQHPQVVRDKLALFNLPALEIDTDVDGLFVIRGLTISLSNLKIVAHGVELGLKLAPEVELAIFVDKVDVLLFRGIEIGDVYANIKGSLEMTWTGLEDEEIDDQASEDNVFMDNTPLLRVATAGSMGFKDRPKLRESLTGVSYVRDSSARAGLEGVTRLSPDDAIADKEYRAKLGEISASSAIYQSQQRVRQGPKTSTLDNERDIRAAVSAELHSLPSVPHPPPRSVRVTTLQHLMPPYLRRFLHRLPFLLRLLLAPLSYFHPINISSITAAGSGQWLSALLRQEVFKSYTDSSAELRRLHRRISHWLADASFCLELTDIYALGQVPLSTYFDIITYLKFDDVMAYRVAPQCGTIAQVVRLGGADATFTIPSFLLPHHEHLIPEKLLQQEDGLQQEVEHADGIPKAVQAERALKRAQKDETTIAMSVHGSLPVSCDQSLLNFIAALVKATKIIELETEVDTATTATNNSGTEESGEPLTPTSPTMSFSETDDISPTSPDTSASHFGMKEVSSFKVFARNIRHSLREGTKGATITEYARELHQSAKDGIKKAAIGGLVNDRWIAKIVGKTAAMLQKARGDVGYSGSIPVSLAPYRAEPGLESKLLP